MFVQFNAASTKTLHMCHKVCKSWRITLAYLEETRRLWVPLLFRPSVPSVEHTEANLNIQHNAIATVVGAFHHAQKQEYTG